MTIIRPNSIAGITSLTALGTSIDFYDANGIGVDFNNVNLNNTSGVSTFNSINATSIVGVSTIGVTTAYVTNINDGPLSGTRNRIINGSFEIWQRGTTFTDMVSATTYTADRWSCYRDAYTSGITVSQVTGLSQNGTNRIALRCQRTNGNASTAGMSLTQSFESINSRDLAGQTVTLSFWARAGSNYSASSSFLSSVIATGTGTDQVTRGAITNYTASSSNNTLTTSFQRFTLTATLASNINQIHILFFYTPTGTAGAADYFDIMDVQLEPGPIATPFERRSYSQEFALCARYYESIDASGSVPVKFGNDGMCISSTVALFQVGGFYPKRVVPAATLSSPGTFAVVNSAGSLIIATNVNIINYGTHNASMTLTVASGLTAGNATQLYSVAGQTPKIQLSSEL